MNTKTRYVIGVDEEYVPRNLRTDPTPGATHGPIVGRAQVTGAPSGLKLRDAPVDGALVTLMPNNAVVGVGQSGTAGWAWVEYNGKYGYASSQYLAPVRDEPGLNKTVDVQPPRPAPTPITPPPAPTPVTPKPAPLPLKAELKLSGKVAVALLAMGLVSIPVVLLLRKASQS